MRTIELTKEVLKNIAKETYYGAADFKKDAEMYIKAVESGRILYTVTSVSRSGMSRNINIKSFEGEMTNGYYQNYIGFLKILGKKVTPDGDIRVGGCGMNMVFATNYDIINQLMEMGFIDPSIALKLAQKVN